MLSRLCLSLCAAMAVHCSVVTPAMADGTTSAADGQVSDAELTAAYDAHLRRRLPRKMNAVVDGAFALHGLPSMVRDVTELWRQLRDDPDLQALASNVVSQYRPRLAYAAYAGAVVQSSGYAGAAFGMEADLVAPLCRYIGGSFDGQLFDDGDSQGLAYDSRVTGCLPWGPFALELGLTSQRSVRMGLAAAPTSAASRYDALGFELRIRGFRWITPRWEVVTIPTEVSFVDMAPATGDGRENAHFTVNSAFARHIRYGGGAAGEDRVIDAMPVRVTGQQDADGAMLSATVVAFGLVRIAGVRVSDGFYVYGDATVQQGSVGSTIQGSDRSVRVLSGGVDASVHWVSPRQRSHVRYSRGLIPDGQFRLLSEDRGEVGVSRIGGSTTLAATTFAAYTRTVGRDTGAPILPAATTYGTRLDYGRDVYGPFYLTVRGEAARSFYAGSTELALDRPSHEIRFTAGIAASAGSSHR